ncbi:MAG: hypothetical protein AB9835_12840 [Eubacteriales bacterium]
MNDIYSLYQDIYPLVKKRFDLRYASRMDVIGEVCDIIDQDSVDYRFEGVGGYGELPVYGGTAIQKADQKRAFITTITPVEHAVSVDVSHKKLKSDISGEAKRIGTRLADSAYMTVLNSFYRLFQNAYADKGADGVSWAADSHPVNCEAGCPTFSNLLAEELSVASITKAQTQASRYITPDGLPFAGCFDLLLVSPELEPKAKEICGPNARLSPERNPDTDGNGANPLYGMKYIVIGGGGVGFSSGQWAVADQLQLKEVLKLVYITRPTVMTEQKHGSLITQYIGYTDFGFGYGDARPIVFSNPA